MEYSHIFGSNFPGEIIPVGTKRDVDDTVGSIVTQYYQLMESGDLHAADALYQLNKDLLAPYLINMEYINRLEEEIYNVGLAVLNKSSNIVSVMEPASQSEGSFWYKEV